MPARRFARAAGAPYIALLMITLAGACTNGEAATVPTPPAPADPAPSLGLTVTPAAITVEQGQRGTATVSLARTNFTGAVTLVAAGAPAGLAVTAPNDPVTAASATLSVQAAASVAAGDYPITLIGTAAGVPNVTTTFTARVAAAAPPPQSEAGVVTGVARDARGQPIANALVEVKMVFNPNVVATRTGADGRYVVRGLPAGLSHQVKAWTEVAYRGQSYCVRLAMPNDADYDAFVPSTTVVRDFRWQLTGRIPDAPANVFGAGVDVDTWDVSGIRTGDEIEVQFTPQGPLVDGSAGSAITRVVRFGSNLAINDLPHGVYTTAATLVQNGVRTPLKVARAGLGAELAATTTVEWEPELAGAACNQKLGPALKRFPLKVSNR